MIKYIPTLVVCLLVCVFCNAQNIETENLRWKVSYVDNVNAGERVSFSNGQLVSYGAEKVEWHNDDSSIKNIFLVNKTSGSWSNISESGSIVYQVKDGSRIGTLTFERLTNDIMVRLVWLNDNADTEILEIKIMAISSL
jgi:hypothetical protein